MTIYKNTEITLTDVTCLNNGKKLYKLTGAVHKDASVRPLITTIKQAREFISTNLHSDR